MCLRAKRKPFGDAPDKINTWQLAISQVSLQGCSTGENWLVSREEMHSAMKSSKRNPSVEPLGATWSLSVAEYWDLCLACSTIWSLYEAPIATVPDNFPYTKKYT